MPEDDTIEALPPNAVTLRLVTAVVASRIRQRALLEVLDESGVLDFPAYRDRYVELVERDSQALTAQLMLKREDFLSLFTEWERQDKSNYGARAKNRADSRGKTRKKASNS